MENLKPAHFLVFAFLLILFSCTNDENPIPMEILGTWENITEFEESTYDILNRYHFDKNGQFEYSRLYQGKGGTDILGYYSFTEGTYTIDGNHLTPFYSKSYLNLQSNVTNLDKDELVLMEVSEEYQIELTYRFDFNNNGNEIIFSVINCPPNVKCITARTYKKVN